MTVGNSWGAISDANSLLLEHHHGIFLHVLHVYLVQHPLLFHAQFAELGNDLSLQEVFVAVVGIVGRLKNLVVESVTSHPLVNATLERKDKVTILLREIDLIDA